VEFHLSTYNCWFKTILRDSMSPKYYFATLQLPIFVSFKNRLKILANFSAHGIAAGLVPPTAARAKPPAEPIIDSWLRMFTLTFPLSTRLVGVLVTLYSVLWSWWPSGWQEPLPENGPSTALSSWNRDNSSKMFSDNIFYHISYQPITICQQMYAVCRRELLELTQKFCGTFRTREHLLDQVRYYHGIGELSSEEVLHNTPARQRLFQTGTRVLYRSDTFTVALLIAASFEQIPWQWRDTQLQSR